jgi:DNA invertase Pin-like site-specific DNA recombinase
MARVALYLRCSTDLQDTARQRAELEAWATRAGHEVVATYEDYASGSKGADRRPGLAALLKACAQRHHDIVGVHAVDRIARSMQHLLTMLDTLHATGVDLYIHTQALDTRTPSGRAMFLLSGIFAELERAMIKGRIDSGIALARSKGVKFGRPRIPTDTADRARDALRSGLSIRKVAELTGLAVGSVARLRAELAELGQLPHAGVDRAHASTMTPAGI